MQCAKSDFRTGGRGLERRQNVTNPVKAELERILFLRTLHNFIVKE